MKNYEQKYKEAIEAMKDCIPDKDGYVTVRPCDIFPELKESEDEKIRKAILDYLTIMWGNSQDDICGVNVEDVLSWLEKQGKPKWSEEDDGMVACIKAHLRQSLTSEAYTNYRLWLESLKQRMEEQE